MPTTRREFIKQAALLSAAGALEGFPGSIDRAAAIEPAPGSTFLDAEHVVILMQENRSFDHAFGSLRGVRGFNDPRAIRLPDGIPVWAQPDGAGRRILPFRLNIKDSKATWMGSLPHSWANQVDARNGGRYDRWLEVKRSGTPEFASMPLTMGYYTRDDIPFYYELADAFTVCDQNFCSSLTGTTPNRLHLWTGTIRPRQSVESPAHVYNDDVDYGRWASWPTFPERLEDLGVTWKVYQNELSLESGLAGEHDAWLANFSDNPLEWFEQYNVRFARTHRRYVRQRLQALPGEIEAKQAASAAAKGEVRERLERELGALRAALTRFQAEQKEFSGERWQALSERDRRLHERAFDTNSGDPDFRTLSEILYQDGDATRRVPVPKGDILHQFRKDVQGGKLPTVSWLVPPERVSDHPSSAWYGAWYLSEVLDILTKDPKVWQKTVFILTYDENDGYFDHVPPFVAPDPSRPDSGRVSPGIDAALEQVTMKMDWSWHGTGARQSPIGLGFRVPMVIASPWSRGGYVCSEVFDHTSVLRFLERLLSQRTGKEVREPNINSWRRAVCGDLTSAFAGDVSSQIPLHPIGRDAFVEQIHRAKFKGVPVLPRALSEAEAEPLKRDPFASELMPRQEKGLRLSRGLPYELFAEVNAAPGAGKDGGITLRLEARRDLFGARAAGAAFIAYAMGEKFACRNYAVEAGASVEDSWPLAEFGGGRYHLRLYGPNGFFREFMGRQDDPALHAAMSAAKPGMPEHVELVLRSTAGAGTSPIVLSLRDESYGNAPQRHELAPGASAKLRVPVRASHGWYDFTLSEAGGNYTRRFAGRLETGVDGFSDPLLSRNDTLR